MPSTTNGSFAVVTGASSGIGLELAKQFAQHGFDLLIVADSPKIGQAASALKQYNVSISEAQIDLAKPGGLTNYTGLFAAPDVPWMRSH